LCGQEIHADMRCNRG